ncbi:fat-like cadherin-related tumor suppressor homolog [Anopheles aquasalis]|uniref:fat-like cadherin-related tumor suppressor homolog n=1 Tax=Anopheles aquasalis TaxID=42839 RepID=UPI00215A1DFC|nr:fat-like cadherin-related tumor suppressor homolog [Anopheles aquasalis]
MVLKQTISVLYCLVLLHVRGQLIDNRCYLDGGGSAVNFFANEDITVGSTVGSLRVLGDPGKDIVLTLREKDSPVYIAPGTKDLIVAKPLDKEGLIGPSAVFVNVICERKFSDETGIIIPVNIRVTDVNDNAPMWIGAPYKLNLSEVTVIGTRILQGIRAIDLDQPGPYSTVEYQTLPGPFSDYVAFVTPLEGTLVLKKFIDYESVQNFTVKMRAQDQGKPPKYSDTYVTIIVLDSDDQNPKFMRDVYYGQLPTEKGEIKITPETIRAEDQDRGIRADIRYSIVSSNGSEDEANFEIHPTSGVIRLVRAITPSQGRHSRTLVVKATQVDNPDRYALTTVVLSSPKQQTPVSSASNVVSVQPSIGGAEFVRGTFYATVREDSRPGTLISQLTGAQGSPNVGQFRYAIAGSTVAQEQFRIGPAGEIILVKPLTFRRTPQYAFTIDAFDDRSGGRNFSTSVVIDVLPANVWEPRFRKPFYSFVIDSPLQTQHLPVLVGRIEAADGDRTDELTFALKGNYSNLFRADPYGNLWLVSNRTDLPVAMRLLATVTDSGTPPKSATVPVVVKLRPETASLTSNLLVINIVVACILGTLLLGGCIRCIYRRRKRKVSSAEQIVAHGSNSSSGGGVPPLKHGHSSNRFLLQRAEQRMLERPSMAGIGRLNDCAASSTYGSDNQDFIDGERENQRRSQGHNARALEQEELAGQNLNHLLLHWQEKYDEKNNCTEDVSIDDKLIVYF